MKHFPLFLVVAALAAAVPAQVQVSFAARFGGRHGGIAVQQVGDGACRIAVRDDGCQVPEPRAHRHGRWQIIEEQVLVPGYWREEHVPPTYGWVRDCHGRRRWGVVDPGGCRRVWVPARWETRCRRVWVSC
jgi:hypothetical protein